MDLRHTVRRQSTAGAGNAREEGGTLIAVVVLVAILALFSSAILSYVSQSYQAVAFARDRTQALYNARMGMDAAISLIERDAGRISPQSSTAYMQQLQDMVNRDLQQLSGPPFADVVTVGSPVAGAFQVTMKATGVCRRGMVTLTEAGGLQVTGHGKGAGSGSVVSVSVTSRLQDVSNLRVTRSGAAPITLTGSGKGGSIVVNGAAASVTGFSHGHSQVTVIRVKNASVTLVGAAAAVWVKGSGDTVSGRSNRVAVVTGANNTLTQKQLGLLVATGSNATTNAATRTALLLGTNDTLNGSVTCGALVTGNGAALTGPKITGPLVITGNNVVVGSPQHPASIKGEVALIGNGITVYGDISDKKGTAVLAVGKNEVIDGSVRGNISDGKNNLTVNGAVKGSTTPFVGGQSVTIGGKKGNGSGSQGKCLGAVTVNFAAASSAPRLNLNFAGATISG